jgi:hypothetical protein
MTSTPTSLSSWWWSPLLARSVVARIPPGANASVFREKVEGQLDRDAGSFQACHKININDCQCLSLVPSCCESFLSSSISFATLHEPERSLVRISLTYILFAWIGYIHSGALEQHYSIFLYLVNFFIGFFLNFHVYICSYVTHPSYGHKHALT